tara:strand:- start:404 stop:643 length:240 start_codon:yes stop_codon:yes gene_type:complete
MTNCKSIDDNALEVQAVAKPWGESQVIYCTTNNETKGRKMKLESAEGVIFILVIFTLAILFGGEPDLADSIMKFIDRKQ